MFSYTSSVEYNNNIQAKKSNIMKIFFLQVQLKRDDNGNSIKVDLDHSVEKCEGSNTVLITTTITGNFMMTA